MEFKKFDIVSDDVTNHTFINKGKPISSECSRYITKEWKILEENLPDSMIYVRVFEKRMDLLRAVIVGAQGTPYHDGLFFFDVLFPPDYPQSPPNVFYLSRGLRINPNLFTEGDVCLSLIDTWHGAESEVWIPNSSTILQVLVSLQALILNAEPYYNEDTNDSLGKRGNTVSNASNAYNEETFIKSLKTMIYNIQAETLYFDKLVVEHFRLKGSTILAAIKAYENGDCLVGKYTVDGASSSRRIKRSKTFKSDLVRVHADLVRAFENIGVSMPEIEESADKEGEDKPNRKGPFGKLKDAFKCCVTGKQ